MESRTDNLVRDGVVEMFWAEFMACWHRVPNKRLFFVMLGAWGLLFQFLGNGTFGYLDTPSLFKWMIWAYNTGGVTDDSHGNIVPFVVLWLFWWKRKELLAVEMRSWWPGVFIVVLALGLHVLCYSVQQVRGSIPVLFIGIYGLMGVAWGAKFLRASFFPFVLFLFAMPLGTQGESITFNLRLLMTVLVELIARGVLGIDVVRQGTGLFDAAGAYQYDVAPACSGIRSLWAMFILATAYGYVTFRASTQWVVLMLAAFPLAVIGNAFRLLLIVIAAKIGGRSWGDFVHENIIMSMLPYVPVIIGLALLTRWLTRLKELLAKEANAKEASA
jgi:exosortase